MPEGVTITQIQTVAAPMQTVAGVQMSLQVIGLGSDNGLYTWDGKTHSWRLL
jgi:hypothetical protein